MSLPPELRFLCFQLSNTPPSDLPRLTPTLLRHVSRCHVALSSPAENVSKADASASSIQVQVHKLKTQLSTLLNGKSPEGRFTAVVLIKAVVETGGWEVLRGAEPWVRGLLSILGKPDSAVTKEICILALTKIYCMTQPYQTLVREITTPTLPAFITSCLNVLSSKSSKTQDFSPSTSETVLRSFAALLPRHTTIYRPFVFQIRAVVNLYSASTMSDGTFVPASLAESARCLVVLLHLTVAKNAGGEEWGKAVLDLVKDIHVTADRVFRAVVEDWESAAGYLAEPVDFNAELLGVARTADNLPLWTGIGAGVERLVGLLGLLAEYFKSETSIPVSVPLSAVIDMLNRMLSIPIPSLPQYNAGQGSVRLHPAVDRDERDGLWSGLPQIYVAALQVISVMADRLQEGFMPAAQGFLDQLAWVFPYGKQDLDFRLHAYRLTQRLLRQTGQTLGKTSHSKCRRIIQACCHDLIPVGPRSTDGGSDVKNEKKSIGGVSNRNVDTFLQNSNGLPQETNLRNEDLVFAAMELLPLFMSHFPQQHMDISLRSLIERTAILSHNKDAMLSSVLNPFVGKHGKAVTGILPHLTREFPSDGAVEILLRPRMPLVPSTNIRWLNEEIAPQEDEYQDMEIDIDEANIADASHGYASDGIQPVPHLDASLGHDSSLNHHGLGRPTSQLSTTSLIHGFRDSGTLHTADIGSSSSIINDTTGQQISFRPDGPLCEPRSPTGTALPHRKTGDEGVMEEVLNDSDDESVHLTMQLDTDSEPEEEQHL